MCSTQRQPRTPWQLRLNDAIDWLTTLLRRCGSLATRSSPRVYSSGAPRADARPGLLLHGVRGPGREWTIVPSQCPACALEEEERSETSGTSSNRLGRPQSSTYGRHVSVWGMSLVAGSHSVVVSAVSVAEGRSHI